MLGVVLQPEVPVNDGGDAVGSPELVGPAVMLGPLEQELFEVVQLLRAEARRRPRMRLGVQAGLAVREAPPAMDRGFMHAEDSGNDGGGFATLHEFDRATAAAFEFSCGSNWSCHALLYARSHPRQALAIRDSVIPDRAVRSSTRITCP